MGVVCKNLQTELALQRKESMPNRNKAPLKNTPLIDLPVKVKGRWLKCVARVKTSHIFLFITKKIRGNNCDCILCVLIA